MITMARFNKTTITATVTAAVACVAIAAAIDIAPVSGQIRSAQAAQPSSGASALVGTWGFTSISGTTYWDKSTGAYMGSGSGGSQSYTFAPDGTYKLFNYVKAGSYGWEMQTLTWENGRYTVKGDTITLRPTSGKYQVMDNRVKKNNYTRPMRADEIRKNAKTVVWRVEQDDNGKSVLRLGKNPDNLSSYQRAK
jgi:hypothetical protein